MTFISEETAISGASMRWRTLHCGTELRVDRIGDDEQSQIRVQFPARLFDHFMGRLLEVAFQVVSECLPRLSWVMHLESVTDREIVLASTRIDRSALVSIKRRSSRGSNPA